METNFAKIKHYLCDLDLNIVKEDENEEIFVVENEEEGITNLIIGVANPILILEQFLFDLNGSESTYKKLLKKNRDIVHGAFVLDDTGEKVIFRDTLQVENLDINELAGSINSLSLLLSEYSNQIIKFSKQ